MKRVVFTLIFASMLLCMSAMPITSTAQTPPRPSATTAAATPVAPPNTKKGYYVKDGDRHDVFILRQNKKDNAFKFVVPPQEGHAEVVVYTPDRVSEWGFEGEKARYLGVRVETPEGDKWYFMEEEMDVKPGDGSRIALLSDKVLPVGTYYRVGENGETIETGTERNAAPMLDYFASTTSYRSSDSHLKYPKRARKSTLDRYHDAFADRNDKLFPQRRFGFTVSGGPGIVKTGDIFTIAHDFQVPSPDMGSTFSAGAFVRLPIEGTVSFQPEVMFSHTSATGEMAYRDLEFDKIRFSMSSVRIPLLFRFTPVRSTSNWMPYLELGPEIDLNFGTYKFDTIEVDPTNGSLVVGDQAAIDLSRMVTGFAAGAGVEYYMNSRQAAWLGVRYSHVSNLFTGPHSLYYLTHRIEIVAAFSLFNF